MLSARKIIVGILLFIATGMLAFAAAPATVQGTILDSADNPVSGAQVTLTNTATQAVLTVVTHADGSYNISGLTAGTYTLTVTKEGFESYSEPVVHLAANQVMATPIKLNVSSVAQTVTVTARGSSETAVTEATISRSEIEDVVGPFGSAAQDLTAAPGFFVYSYGGVASTARSEIELRGIKGGWTSVNGDIERNGITFTLDGIPMNNLISNNGHWQTTQLPIMDMISNIAVDYGPGAPSDRWYDSLGGTVNYIPVQPHSTPGFTAGASFGSYNTFIEHFIAHTGAYKGWSGVLSSGYASNDTFRVGTTGIPTFNAPSSGYAAFTKVQKLFNNGVISFGYYHGRNTEYRPNFIPSTPIAANGDIVTTQGLFGVDRQPSSAIPATYQLYSQPTSGFYSSLAKALWWKQAKTQSDIVYSKLQLTISPHLTFDTQQWYRHGYRRHARESSNWYGPNYTTGGEWYDPASNVVGDKSIFTATAPHNLIRAGGYWIHSEYHTQVFQFNPALGTSRFNAALFGSFKLFNDYGFLFAQDRIDLLSKKLILTPGLAEQLFRTSFFNVALSEYPNMNPANDPFITADSNKDYAHLAPSVGAQYLAQDWLTLHANYAITYQNPTDNAFGSYQVVKTINLNALKAIQGKNVEAGFLLTKCPAFMGLCSLDATYFRNQLSNEDVIIHVQNLFIPAKVSLASALYNGISINFDDAVKRHIEIHGNGIIQHDYFLSYVPAGTTINYGDDPISNTPKYTTNIGLTTSAESKNRAFQVTPGLWWQYVGTRYLFSNVTGAPTTQTMPGYGVVNFNMNATLDQLGHAFHNTSSRILKSPLQMSLGVENLLGKQYNPTAYISSGGYFGTSFGGYTLVDPGAPREFIVSLNFGTK